jgi:hypothetical protein
MLALNSFVLRLNENPKAGKGRLSIFWNNNKEKPYYM